MGESSVWTVLVRPRSQACSGVTDWPKEVVVRLGIGGKVGPLRAGVSTRGYGVGAGPIKITGGYGRRSPGGGGNGDAWAFAFAVVFGAMALAIALILLPFLFGWHVWRRLGQWV